MCMVEMESNGRTKMDTACTAQVSENLVVSTKSEKAITPMLSSYVTLTRAPARLSLSACSGTHISV